MGPEGGTDFRIKRTSRVSQRTKPPVISVSDDVIHCPLLDLEWGC